MSAILSADDLNDFISPGVACIKPIETIPKNQRDSSNPYEVTTEDKVNATNPLPAEISLTDCLACSGCVTSAEAVLVSLQSHNEVLKALDTHPPLSPPWLHNGNHDDLNGHTAITKALPPEGKIFIATVSPQARASLAATYNITSKEAGNMINQLLRGTQGLAPTTPFHTSFLWVLDTNSLRPIIQTLAYTELVPSSASAKPLLSSACPGWICYAEKTHPHILPHLSRLKSPQALAGTLLKSVLAAYGVPPERVWHLAIMPCFDKKLEAARTELISSAWAGGVEGVRDVDCVITAREVVALAEARGIAFAGLPRARLSRVRFPDQLIERVLFHTGGVGNGEPLAGTSGGILWHVLRRFQSTCPGSRIKVERGRNTDVVEYSLVLSRRAENPQGPEEVVFKAARYYGFRNIQNLVRKLKPPRTSRLLAAAGRSGGARRLGAATSAGKEGVLDYAYVEVMACPGGCTNGGGQINVGDVVQLRGELDEDKKTTKIGPREQREWLGRVDEAYFSASDEDEHEDGDEMEVEEYRNAMDSDGDVVDGISWRHIHDVLEHWKGITSVELDKLVYTSYREVESNVGKQQKSDVERVAGLASSIGGGW